MAIVFINRINKTIRKYILLTKNGHIQLSLIILHSQSVIYNCQLATTSTVSASCSGHTRMIYALKYTVQHGSTHLASRDSNVYDGKKISSQTYQVLTGTRQNAERIRPPLVSFNHVTDPHFVTFSSSLYTTIGNPNPKPTPNPNPSGNPTVITDPQIGPIDPQIVTVLTRPTDPLRILSRAVLVL